MNRRKFVGIGMAQDWLSALPADPFIKTLQENGVQFLEYNITESSWPKQVKWMEKAFELGLWPSFHAPYRDAYDLSYFVADAKYGTAHAYETLFEKVASFCREKKITGRINLHGPSSASTDKKSLFGLTNIFLAWLEGKTKEHQWPLEYVMEILPGNKRKEKIGTNPQDLVEVKAKNKQILTGFCWDFGHYLWNEYGNTLSPIAEKFVKDVRHVHVHDFRILKNFCDHYPLDFGIVPWQNYLNRLADNPLQIVLEINFEKACERGEPQGKLLESIQKMNRFLQEGTSFYE